MPTRPKSRKNSSRSSFGPIAYQIASRVPPPSIHTTGLPRLPRLSHDASRDGRLRAPFYGPGNSGTDMFTGVDSERRTIAVMKAPESSWRSAPKPRSKKNKKSKKNKSAKG